MKALVAALILASLIDGLAVAADKPALRDLEVLVTADAIASPDGFRPKAGQPIRYVFNQARQSLGEAVAGVKLPEPALVERAVVAELAKQGFVRAEVGSAMPSLYIIVMIGDANFQEPPDDQDIEIFMPMVDQRQILIKHGWQIPTMGELEKIEFAELVMAEAKRWRYRLSPRFKDKAKIENLVGAAKVIRAVDGGALSRSDGEKIAWSAHENRYYVSLTAYDAERWAKKEKVMLWRTSMLIDWRKDFVVDFPAMLAQAGPLFGTDAPVPVFLNGQDRKKAEVKIGDLKVVPDETKPAEAPNPPEKK